MKKLIINTMAFLLLSVTLFAQKNYDLKLNPANGSKYNFTSNSAVLVKQSMMGQDMEIKMDYSENSTYEFSKTGPDYTIKMTFDKVKSVMEAMGNTIEMDTESPDTSNDFNKYIGALKNSTLTALVTDKGEVKKIDGLDELQKKLENSVDASKRDRIAQMAGSFLSEESIKGRMENSLKIYPANPVKTGDTWKAVTKMSKPYETTTSVNYTLKNVSDGKAAIASAGELSTNGDQKMQNNGMEMTVNLAGTQSGTALMDIGTGITTNVESSQTAKGKLQVMGQEVPMEVSSKTTSSLSKK